jgi:hypothetical protein
MASGRVPRRQADTGVRPMLNAKKTLANRSRPHMAHRDIRAPYGRRSLSGHSGHG